MEAVWQLDAPTKFSHFVKRVVDAEEAWGLWRDGWALSQDDDGTMGFPLWPAPEYADACRNGEWTEYLPRSIALDELLNELLPGFVERQVVPAVFPDPMGRSILVSVAEVDTALRAEMTRYE